MRNIDLCDNSTPLGKPVVPLEATSGNSICVALRRYAYQYMLLMTTE